MLCRLPHADRSIGLAPRLIAASLSAAALVPWVLNQQIIVYKCCMTLHPWQAVAV